MIFLKIGRIGRIALRTTSAAAVVGMVLALPAPSSALTNDPGADTLQRVTPDNLVRRAQRALAELGLYRGPISGLRDSFTEGAVRAYQKANGIKEDGVLTEELVAKIEAGSKVSALLNRLEQVRKDTMAAARAALLSRAETRDLVGGGATEAADPTRDAGPCFRQPTADCLLAEAVETSKAIAGEEQRDWALVELLAAQAKAGLAEEGRQTLRRMTDPRQIMASLRDIAEAQATAGRGREALEATEIIPDPLRKAEAYGAIIDIQASRSDAEGARETAQALGQEVEKVNPPVKRLTFHARTAVALEKVGAKQEAEAELEKARVLARRMSADEQSLALRTVGTAMAEMGRPGDAIAEIQKIRKNEERTPVLVAAASAQADAGNTNAALNIAADIAEGRYRAVALARIAAAQIKAGEIELAKGTISLALAVLADIKLPYARDYALSRVSAALNELARSAPDEAARESAFTRSIETARKIEDKKLRALTLWGVTAERQRAGDLAGAEATRALADKATSDVESRLSQVWLLADLVAGHVDRGEIDIARQVFQRGLAIAEEVQNAWSRTRLLSKLAASLVRLNAAEAAVPR
jgi:tetratricopeptide (TPR) repeat protein